MIIRRRWVFNSIFLLIAWLINLNLLFADVLPDFNFSVEVSHESCSADGAMRFSVDLPGPGATVIYRVFLKPDLDKPIAVQEGETLNNLTAGDYRVFATVEYSGESRTNQRDVTISHAYQPIEFNIISGDICSAEDGTITVEMVSGNASSYQIRGPVDIGPQAENVFEGLAEGSYVVQVTNECGERLSKTVEILDTDLSIDGSRLDFHSILPSCGEITVGQYIRAVGSGIRYPVTLEFLVDVPGGGTASVQSVVTEGQPYEGFVYGTIPFFNNTAYTYDVRITDACGNEAISENNVVDRQLTVSEDLRWGSGSCGERMLAISPINYTAPYSVNFISYPDGFDPAPGEGFTAPFTAETTLFNNGGNPIPDGRYIFQITDACGNTSEEIRMDHRQVVFGPSQVTYQGCGPGEGSVQLMNYDYQFTKVEILSAPPGYLPALPHDVSEHIYQSDGRRFAINSLPEGDYEFYVETDCGTNHTTQVTIEGLEVTENEVDVIETCGSFNLALRHNSTIKNGNEERFGLQKFDPVSRTWGHPATGEPYIEGDNLNDGNSARLFNKNTTYNLPFSGTFRVVKTTASWKNGSEITTDQDRLTYCVTTLREFTLNNTIGFSSINSFSCTGDEFDVSINATGYAPISYKITTRNGEPFPVDNGDNPLFQGLEEGLYAFQIQDDCGNILNKTLEVSQENVPRIIPSNLCHGENGELAISGMDFLEFEWWKDDDPSNILSRDASLPFAPFDRDLHPGLYKVRISHEDPRSCLNEVLEFEIPADDDGPQAGTGGSSTLCEGEIVDLFTLLEGPFDDYGYWEELTGSNSLVGNFWTTRGLSAGVYEFVYIVPGLCNDEDRVNLSINLLSPPPPPVGEPVQSVCAAINPTVADLFAEGESVSWYLSPEGGSPLPSDQLLTHNTVYYASQTVDGCTSERRLESRVLLEQPVENNIIGTDQQLARNKSAKPLEGSIPTGGTGVYEFQWQFSLDSVVWEDIPKANKPGFNPGTVNTTVYFRRLVKGACMDYISNPVKITVITVDVSITKTSFNKALYDGEPFTYEIFVENTGEFEATQLTVSDQLPGIVDYISHNIEVSSPDIRVTHAVNGKFVSFFINRIAVGQSVAIQLEVIPDGEGYIKNTAGVESREEDADPSNNLAHDQNKILPMFIPNVIKPDFDGKNEFFVINQEKFESIDLVIFNRWGDHVYESKDYKNDWSADGLNAGTYYYVINALDKGGKARVYKGWVQVIK